MHFDHEDLVCYQLALEVALWVDDIEDWPPRKAGLRDQLERASTSAVLNIAEGRARLGKAGRNHYRIARGSAAEGCAALDLLRLPGFEEQQVKLRRVGAMLTRLM